MSVSLQLYSMRNGDGWDTILPALPEIGITKVEAFGALLEDADALIALLQAAKLSMPSCHMDLAAVEADPHAAAVLAKRLGSQTAIIPYLPPQERPGDVEGYRALAARLARLVPVFKASGIALGWHNHEFEFVPVEGGARPLDIILEGAPDLLWEADLAWVIKGGADPLTYLKHYGARICAVHVKDIAAAGTNLDEDGWADLGQGIVDWPGLLAYCRTLPQPIEYILEHDNPSDPMRFARASAAMFNSIWQRD